MVVDVEIRVLQCGGSRINYRRPLFSADSKYLVCVSGNSIKVFSTVTEECIHVLWNHSDLVTGIELNPNNPLQLYSCSLDGTVKLWDFTDGILIKTFLIGFKLFSLYTASKQDSVYVLTQSNNSSETFQLMSVKLLKSTEQQCEVKEKTVLFEDVSQSPKSTAVGRNGEYIVTVKGLCLFVYYLKNKKRFRFPLRATSKKGANNTFTVVTCHPIEDCIATGHKDGKIRLWRSFNHKQDYTYSSLHWHHDSVADLAFSVQGTILYSGGIESVLVQWSHSLEHKREFLPRLGAAIEHIATSPDGSWLCTSHMDNKITIIDTNLKVTGIIQGLVKGNVKTGLIFDPRTKALVLNGKPGHLQFYSLHDDKQLYNGNMIEFLDLKLIGIPDCTVSSSTFRKETAGNTVLHFDSYHYPPYFLSDKRTDLVQNLFKQEADQICSRLTHRGYPRWALACALEIVDKSRPNLLSATVAKFSRKLPPTLVLDYNAQYRDIKQIVEKYIPTLLEDESMEKFCMRLSMSCRRSPKQWLDIVQQEFVNQAGLQHIDLVKVALNAKGNWLATVEELKRKGTDYLEVQMKFWEFNDKLQSFVLNTTINLPHEHQITSLSFQCDCDSQKDTPTLVTTGDDGLFKVWVLEDNSDIYRQSRGWSCDFLASYHGFKATASSFSEDGSLLAVSFEDIITIWESCSWDLKHTFCHPPGKIRSLCFGRMSSSKYLLASTDNGFINCWDILTCNLTWKAQLDAVVLQPDCVSENIAAFSFISGSSTLFIFNPADPVPLYVHTDVCPSCVQWAVFVPRELPEFLSSKNHKWLIKSQLYFLMENQELMTFSTKSPEEMLKPLSKRLVPEESLPFTPFFTLLEIKRQQKQMENKTDMQLEKSSLAGCKTQDTLAIKELLHTPAHVLPTAAILCSMFVDSLLIFQQHKGAAQDSKDLDMESEKAEEDSDEDLTKESQDPILTGNSCRTPLKLLKSEEKELRRIKRRDFTWVSVL